MSLALLAAIAIATPQGIPSSVRAECAEITTYIAHIKSLQIGGKTEGEIAEILDNEGYEIEGHEELVQRIIKATFLEMGTPESIGRKEMQECLEDYLKNRGK